MTPARTFPQSHRLGVAILLTYAAILASAWLGGWSRGWSSLGVRRLIFLIAAVPFINTLRRSHGLMTPAAGLVGLSSLAIAMSEEPLSRIFGFRGVLTAVACKIVVLSVMADPGMSLAGIL